MQCKIEDCDKPVRYKNLCLCQKHYFRVWRYGRTENKKAKPFYDDARGYRFVYAPDHPLKVGRLNYIAEHRLVLFEKIGQAPMQCELCGVQLQWETCHVDHIDENKSNNAPDNLRSTCRTCNTRRNMKPAHLRMPNVSAITFDGETKTATEWSKDSRVKLSHGQILRRKKAGASDFDALFAPKITHKDK